MVRKVKNFNFHEWFFAETKGFTTVIELGAGFFTNLKNIKAKVKIGIEIFQPYIDNADYKDCIMICGNMIHYRDLCTPYWRGKKLAILIDALEHIERPFASKLINDLKEDVDKILVMSPRGYAYQDKDVTNLGNDYHQTHKSFWFEKDFKELKMTEILIDENYHKKEHDFPDKGCFFVKWEK